MKPHLLYPDRDFDLDSPLPPEAAALTQDLELRVLFGVMGGEDELLRQAAEHGLLGAGCTDPQYIIYRQATLRDALAHPALVQELFALAGQALLQEKSAYRSVFSRFPESRMKRAILALSALLPTLHRLREIGLGQSSSGEGSSFTSPAFQRLFAHWVEIFDDAFFAQVDAHIAFLKLADGALISARLDHNCRATAHVLRAPRGKPRNWLQRLLQRYRHRRDALQFAVGYRDEAGTRALTQLRNQGIRRCADALADGVDQLTAFFAQLQRELAFYLGAMRLNARIDELGLPLVFPQAQPVQGGICEVRGLYDINLALQSGHAVVGNDLVMSGKALVLVTGANQGGKSTFLRSFGTAQLLMQAGLCVPASQFSASVCTGVFTHFRREEDRDLRSGKLNEELSRMSELIGHLRPNTLLLMNESFAATNEREGSEIAAEILRALGEHGVRVIFVTHLYAFASARYAERRADTLFLRAQRESDGGRTFRLEEGEPLPTAYGQDLYQRIFQETGAELAGAGFRA